MEISWVRCVSININRCRELWDLFIFFIYLELRGKVPCFFFIPWLALAFFHLFLNITFVCESAQSKWQIWPQHQRQIFRKARQAKQRNRTQSHFRLALFYLFCSRVGGKPRNLFICLDRATMPFKTWNTRCKKTNENTSSFFPNIYRYELLYSVVKKSRNA